MTKDANANAPRTGTQAVERALAILGALEQGDDAMSLTELALVTDLSPSTTHRIARALCDASILFQDPTTERYGFGPRLVSLGARAAATTGLAAAREILDDLAVETGESVNLGVLDGPFVTVLICVSSSNRLRFDQVVGTRVPAHASAMGKAILASSTDLTAEVRSLPGLSRFTPKTITSRAAFKADLIRSREQGWALNDEEREQGVRTIAAAVPGRQPARAAIAIQGPTVRMTDAHIKSIAPLLRASATAISSRLGSAF